MKRFEARLTRAFDEIADRARPSHSALVDFRARAAREVPRKEVVIMLTPDNPRTPRPKWLVPAVLGAAAALIVALAGVIALRSDDDETPATANSITPAEPEPVPLPAPEPVATAGPSTTPTQPAEPEPGVASTLDWTPVLDGVTATAQPQPVSCPEGSLTDLDDPLPVPEFLELETGAVRAVAAFDSADRSVVVVRRGIFVDDPPTLETTAGRLDVCTGDWTPMSADFGTDAWGAQRWPIALVYDVDSDALVAFSWLAVHVYSPDTDEWIVQPDDDIDSGQVHAAYHPSSGRILVLNGDGLFAYDVETADYQRLGTPEAEFVGVNAELDRLVLTLGSGDAHTTRLVDPISGDFTEIATPGGNDVNLFNGFGPDEEVGQADGTVFVSNRGDTASQVGATVCGFRAATLAWDECVRLPVFDGAAIVGDPVHDRILVVPKTGPIRTAPLS